MITKNILTILFLWGITVIVGCKNNGTEPPIIKSPRNYNWSIDTLSLSGNKQTALYSIWGSSPNNVYAVGYCLNGNGQMWHYNGNKWEIVSLPLSSIFAFTSIYGFSQNDVWAVGDKLYPFSTPQGTLYSDSSLIMHFDGANWTEEKNINGRMIFNIYGNSNNDVWALGDETLFHYNGITWMKDSIITHTFKNGAIFNSVATLNETLYLNSSVYDSTKGSFEEYFISYKNNICTVIDSFDSRGLPKWGITTFWVSPSNNLYSSGNGGIFKWYGNKWINIYSSQNILWNTTGTSDENIFALQNGHVYQYNGSDMYEFKQVENNNANYRGLCIFQNDVFVVGFFPAGNPQKSIVLHGK